MFAPESWNYVQKMVKIGMMVKQYSYLFKRSHKKIMNTEDTLVIFALVAALGLVGVVAIDIMLTLQEAEARGCPGTSPGANASRLRCIRP
jgi:hypothetical protein